MSYIPSSYYEIQEAVADSPFFSLLKMSDEEDNILKGDAIGDTLYSEKWLLTTLMKLTEVDTGGRSWYKICCYSVL